ncbi:DMT family transporter [Alkalimarinus alittae]|uniref:DMT family transporter n=1 Tax=Alkalimarinus alittae TaxID=2961619 RepID=A0ABY6N4E8_9ALTE|nr:DMT family transporter [Alkalimarinus alittae]UZE97003.1 DMT family transporter [Alkalimarinus alittae]
MNKTNLQSNILLLITAAIWGFAFVFQRTGMDHVGPFTFNAARFALGTLSLIPVWWWFSSRAKEKSSSKVFYYGLVAGVFLFTGSTFQQVGIQYTTAGKAGFITGLYIVIVPIFALFMGQYTRKETWIGSTLALIGLYLLSVTDDLTIEYGDTLILIGALFWAGHVLVIAKYSPHVSAISLSVVQFAVCALLSFITALFTETIEVPNILLAGEAILFTGILSVGIAYTLQVIAQQNAHPAHAAIILSLEALFAAIGGWLLLNEVLSLKAQIGCTLMLLGMVVSQIKLFKIPSTIGEKPTIG